VISKAKLKKAIDGSYGNVTAIALRLNCARKTVYEKLEKYPELKLVLKDERDKIVDLAENKLLAAVNRGSEYSINLVLRTLGKERGYTEKQEIQHSGEVAGKIVFVESLDE